MKTTELQGDQGLRPEYNLKALLKTGVSGKFAESYRAGFTVEATGGSKQVPDKDGSERCLADHD